MAPRRLSSGVSLNTTSGRHQKADSLKLVGIGLSCISGVKGKHQFKLSPVSSFYLVTSFCTSSKRRFTCRSYARSESVESDDKVSGSHGVCSALRWTRGVSPGSLNNRQYLSVFSQLSAAVEIAIALLFLHQAKLELLVHRDPKRANILDDNYLRKINNVGPARMVYRQSPTKSPRSLQLLLLRPGVPVDGPNPTYTHSDHHCRAIERGTFTEMLDTTVKDWPVEETLRFAKLALKCTELRRKDL
ncbi:hypothetical protein B296_00001268 [Ensete ventricosum]|uniref:RING-type E3 ubiquitin transferase n=1 Tax=Ensete ventricosum TaxID=4639 RepID=A0A427AQ39_ENSVE|nr:hypothetical protein B296_00001268 [Ensete ventricosum]